LTIPIVGAFFLLIGASFGFDTLYTKIMNMLTLTSPKLAAGAAIVILGHVYLFRDNMKVRRQLRRLEAMRREWEERDPEDEP